MAKKLSGLLQYVGKHGIIYKSRIEKEGKTYKRSHGWGLSLSVAKEKHIAFVADVNSGKYDERKKKISFERFVDKYIEYQKNHKRSWEGDVDLTNKLMVFLRARHWMRLYSSQ